MLCQKLPTLGYLASGRLAVYLSVYGVCEMVLGGYSLRCMKRMEEVRIYNSKFLKFPHNIATVDGRSLLVFGTISFHQLVHSKQGECFLGNFISYVGKKIEKEQMKMVVLIHRVIYRMLWVTNKFRADQ